MRVAVIGAGTVGATTAAALAYLGCRVTVAERDPARRRALARGAAPVAEPGLGDLLALARCRLAVVADPAAAARDADVVLVAVGTARGDPQARIAAVAQAVRAALAGHLPPGGGASPRPVVAVRSTLPPGGTRDIARILREAGHPDWPVPLAYQPEFLRQGHALADFLYPHRVVIGSDSAEAARVLANLYRAILDQSFPPPAGLPRPPGYAPPPLLLVDPPTAELIKLGANALLAVKLSFTGELAELCRAWGADAGAVARGIGLDPRLGAGHLDAGLGWGGPCLPADAGTLLRAARSAGRQLSVLAAARRARAAGLRRAADRLEQALGGLAGRRIAVLGLAFKPGVEDLRGSPALALTRLLRRRGAHVSAHDPAPALREAARRRLRLEVAAGPLEAAAGADAVVLATAWPEYARLDLPRLASVLRGRTVFDGRRLWDPEAVRRAGLVYLGVDR